MASLTCEIQWLQYLLSDLHIPFSCPAAIYCDNKSAIYLAHNPTFHERTKHIEIDCHVIREKIQSKLIHLLPVSSTSQIADIFTKPLHSTSFQGLVFKLGLCDIHSPTCGEGGYYLLKVNFFVAVQLPLRFCLLVFWFLFSLYIRHTASHISR